MTVQIHDGEVIHSMDHYVLDLVGDNRSTAYFTVYELGMMRDVGSGLVALVRIATPSGTEDYCFGETIGLAARMQARLRHMDRAPSIGTTNAPLRADIRRDPTFTQGVHWSVTAADHSVSATWASPEASFLVHAPAPSFHAERDYTTVMVGYDEAELVIDGQRVGGAPYSHAEWERRLGRPLSSCHVAFGEIAVEAT